MSLPHERNIFTHVCGYLVACGVAASLWVWLGESDATSLSLSPSMIAVCGLCMALIGVPHGGLDHWVGKRLLANRFGRGWGLIFFPAYLTVGLFVAWAWIAFPIVTVLTFFLLSAWHFGSEELFKPESASDNARFLRSVTAIGTGGLIIWLIAIFRPLEMSQMLASFLLHGDQAAAQQAFEKANTIVDSTRSLGIVLAPLGLLAGAMYAFLHRKMGDLRLRSVVYGATFVMVVFTPIVISFTAYFCFWHSLLGLRRLRDSEQLGNVRFVASIAPLSLLAIVLTITVAWWCGDISLTAFGQQGEMKVMFIGLAAMAVPHILLHQN